MSKLHEEIYELKKNFFKLYRENILPNFQRYEKERIKNFKKCIFLFTLSAIMLGGSIFLYSKYDIGELLIALVMLSLIPLACASFTNYSFATELKNKELEKLLSVFGNIRCNSASDSSVNIRLAKSELFSQDLNCSTDDCFIGNYKGVNFRIEEIHASGDGGRTVFKGVVLTLASNKIIQNKTIIATKNDGKLKKNDYTSIIISSFIVLLLISTIILCIMSGSFFTITLSIPLVFLVGLFLAPIIRGFQSKNEAIKKIKLEDSVFNKMYDVYSSDEVEARYLITPAFIERFKHLQKVFHSKHVKCAFTGRTIIFAFSTNKNLFEIGNIFVSLNDKRTIEQFFNEIIGIYILINHFKLNEKTRV